MRPLILLLLLAPLFATDYVELTLTDGRKLTGLYDGTTLDLFGNGTKIPVAAADIESKRVVERPASNGPSRAVTVAAPVATALAPANATAPTAPAPDGKRSLPHYLPPADTSPAKAKEYATAVDKAAAAVDRAVKEGVRFIQLAVKEGDGTGAASWDTMVRRVCKLRSGKDSSAAFAAMTEAGRAIGHLRDIGFRLDISWNTLIQDEGRKAEPAAGIVR